MSDSEQVVCTNLCAAIAAAQAEAANVARNAVANLGSRKYHYATLDAIRDAVRPIMATHGLALIGMMSQSGINWRLSHSSGEHVEWYTPYPSGAETPHGLGSAVTYLTRYQICLVMGIAAEDDDDAHAAQENASAAPARFENTPPSVESPVKQEGMDSFWRAWGRAKLPNWQKDKEAARVAYRDVASAALGGYKSIRELTVTELAKITQYLSTLAEQAAVQQTDPDDPFASA